MCKDHQPGQEGEKELCIFLKLAFEMTVGSYIMIQPGVLIIFFGGMCGVWRGACAAEILNKSLLFLIL